MLKTDLTLYDIKPEAMINYLRYNGPHFNKKLLLFAAKQMKRKNGNTSLSIIPYTQEEIDNILKLYNILLTHNLLYDYMYVANMVKADFLGSSITTPEQVGKYIHDVIDDEDAYDGIVFNRWYADMSRKGIVINWEEMI